MSFIKECTVPARWGVGKRWHVVTLPLNYPTNPSSLILIIHLNPTAETLIAAREHVKLLNYCFQHKEKSSVVITAVSLPVHLCALHLLTIRSQCNLTNTCRKFLCLLCVISVGCWRVYPEACVYPADEDHEMPQYENDSRKGSTSVWQQWTVILFLWPFNMKQTKRVTVEYSKLVLRKWVLCF